LLMLIKLVTVGNMAEFHLRGHSSASPHQRLQTGYKVNHFFANVQNAACLTAFFFEFDACLIGLTDGQDM
ncbi:MAG: hypothetical protein K2I48_05960, partial [Muribaculaceae bacterium]|nr:hypothetical protein [Muribaculaceae bacterium]